MSKPMFMVAVAALILCATLSVADQRQETSADSRAVEQLIRGNTAAQQGNPYQAIFHYQEALRYDPKSPFLHIALAEQFVQLEQIDRALEELEKALALDERSLDALHLKARILATSGQQKESRVAFESLVKADSANADYKIELLGLCLALGEFDRVDNLFKQVPSHHGLRGDLVRRIVAIYLTSGEVRRATPYLEDLAKTDSADAPVAYTLGTVYLQNGDTARARSEIDRAISNDSTDARAWYVRVVIEYDMENYTGAIAVCERAAAAAGEDARTRNLEGLSHLRLGDSTHAVTLLERALELDSTLFTAAGSLALIYDKHDSLNRVEELYNSAIRFSDSAAVYLNNLAYSYAERGVKLDQAMTLVDLALYRDPKNASYLDTKGWIHFRRGDFETSLRYIKKSIRYDRESAPLLEHAGDVLSAMNKHRQAEKYWKRARRLDPQSLTLPAKLGE